MKSIKNIQDKFRKVDMNQLASGYSTGKYCERFLKRAKETTEHLFYGMRPLLGIIWYDRRVWLYLSLSRQTYNSQQRMCRKLITMPKFLSVAIKIVPVHDNASELSGREYKSLNWILILIGSNILLVPIN